jgi:hypothetical protein
VTPLSEIDPTEFAEKWAEENVRDNGGVDPEGEVAQYVVKMLSDGRAQGITENAFVEALGPLHDYL